MTTKDNLNGQTEQNKNVFQDIFKSHEQLEQTTEGTCKTVIIIGYWNLACHNYAIFYLNLHLTLALKVEL